MKVGLYRRAYNKTLKDEMAGQGFTNKTICDALREKGFTVWESRFSALLNFKYNPNEDLRIAIAIVLEKPIDDIFPEYYDELYERISTMTQHAEIPGRLAITRTDVLQLESPDNLTDEVEEKMLVDNVDSILDEVLSDREREVLRLRTGLGGELPMTCEQAGKRMGVTRERIRQIEAKALEQIRRSDRVWELRGPDNRPLDIIIQTRNLIEIKEETKRRRSDIRENAKRIRKSMAEKSEIIPNEDTAFMRQYPHLSHELDADIRLLDEQIYKLRYERRNR